MHEKSIELLNKAVADELSATHQYMYFHFHCEDQGYALLAGLFIKTVYRRDGAHRTLRRAHPVPGWRGRDGSGAACTENPRGKKNAGVCQADGRGEYQGLQRLGERVLC